MIKYHVTEQRGKNCIVRVHRPILSPEERKAREENIKAALVQFERERMKYRES